MGVATREDEDAGSVFVTVLLSERRHDACGGRHCCGAGLRVALVAGTQQLHHPTPVPSEYNVPHTFGPVQSLLRVA
jgi:hypothetical protein